MSIGGNGGGSTPCLGSGKKLLVRDFWKINKKFLCKSFVLEIDFKKICFSLKTLEFSALVGNFWIYPPEYLHTYVKD